MSVALTPVRYDPADPTTDVRNIVRDPKYSDALILFNDNFEDRNTPLPGGNAAVVRPFVFEHPCRVVGVSTGWSTSDGGYVTLGDDEKLAITLDFERVNTALHLNDKLRRVVYFCGTDRRELGFSIFRPHPTVAKFINEKLRSVTKRFMTGAPVSILALDMAENIVESRRMRRRPQLDKRAYKSFLVKNKIRQHSRLYG